ncbi:hypothetical protein ACVCL0_13530 [Rhodanobacter sp. UC4450_H17]
MSHDALPAAHRRGAILLQMFEAGTRKVFPAETVTRRAYREKWTWPIKPGRRLALPDDDRIQLATPLLFHVPFHLASEAIIRVTFDGKCGTTAVDRWNVGKRLCDIKEALDGSLWMLEDAGPGGLYRLTPK